MKAYEKAETFIDRCSNSFEEYLSSAVNKLRDTDSEYKDIEDINYLLNILYLINNIILSAIGIVPVVWLSLLIAPFVKGGLTEIVTGLMKSFEHPFQIQLCEDSLKTVLFLLAAYAVGIAEQCDFAVSRTVTVQAYSLCNRSSQAVTRSPPV